MSKRSKGNNRPSQIVMLISRAFEEFLALPSLIVAGAMVLAVVTLMLATVGVARRRLRFAAARGRLTWSLVAALPALLLVAAAIATVVVPTALMLLRSRLWQFASL